MSENAQNSVEVKENLEQVLAEAFSPLWELGVLGVKLTLAPKDVRLKMYLLSEVEDGILSSAVASIESKFDSSYAFDKQIVHGIVPVEKIVTTVVSE